MTDDYSLFVIVASMIALVLPSSGTVVYAVFAAVLVGLAGAAGGIERALATNSAGRSTSPH